MGKALIEMPISENRTFTDNHYLAPDCREISFALKDDIAADIVDSLESSHDAVIDWNSEY